jgi:hypothetical protein
LLRAFVAIFPVCWIGISAYNKESSLSSVLKALKKIDENAPPQAIDAKQAMTSGVKKRWRFRRWTTIALILLATAVGGVMMLHRQPFFLARLLPQTGSTTPETSGKNRPVLRSKIPTAPAQTAITHSGSNRPASMSAKPKAATAKRVKLPVDNRPATVGQPPPRAFTAPRSSPKATPGAQQRPGRKNSAINPPAAARKPAFGGRTTARKPITQIQRPPQKSAVTPAYDQITDSTLKLQALAWSNDAARRLAVINGHVVHEGEAVESYQVTQIRQEDVIVHDGRKSWRLVFGLQQ